VALRQVLSINEKNVVPCLQPSQLEGERRTMIRRDRLFDDDDDGCNIIHCIVVMHPIIIKKVANHIDNDIKKVAAEVG